MNQMERYKVKAHLMHPPIGHGHAPIDFGEQLMSGDRMSDEDLIAWHMNAHGVFHSEELHEVE